LNNDDDDDDDDFSPWEVGILTSESDLRKIIMSFIRR